MAANFRRHEPVNAAFRVAPFEPHGSFFAKPPNFKHRALSCTLVPSSSPSCTPTCCPRYAPHKRQTVLSGLRRLRANLNSALLAEVLESAFVPRRRAQPIAMEYGQRHHSNSLTAEPFVRRR
jgi:hypothetical protein